MGYKDNKEIRPLFIFFTEMYRDRNKRNLDCRLKLWANANRAGGSEGFLGSKMPLDWLKIGLNSVKKITFLSLRIPLGS